MPQYHLYKCQHNMMLLTSLRLILILWSNLIHLRRVRVVRGRALDVAWAMIPYLLYYNIIRYVFPLYAEFAILSKLLHNIYAVCTILSPLYFKGNQLVHQSY